MSDEQAPGPKGNADRDGVDHTREFDPFADEQADGGRGAAPADPDRTAAMPGVDRTAPLPSVDQTAAMPGVDRTAPLPSVDQTAAMPGPDRTAPLPSASPNWSGRAAVRAPGPAPAPAQDWAPAAAEPSGKWWMPIVVGVVALLLLALLGVGVWLITQNLDRAPDAVPPVSVAPTATRPSSPPTTEPTTSEPEPTEEEPAEVPVPPVVGLDVEDATDALEDAELAYRVIFRPSDRPAGTVIGSDPRSGRSVPVGSEVTLFVAAERTEPTESPAGSPGSADDGDSGDEGGAAEADED